MDKNIIRKLLLEINGMKYGESIMIDDLHKKFSEIDETDFLGVISKLTLRYYIRIDGKFSHECFNLEKYNKIIGLDKEGLEAIDYIKSEKIWSRVEKLLNDNDYDDCSIFVAIKFAKELINNDFKFILNK